MNIKMYLKVIQSNSWSTYIYMESNFSLQKTFLSQFVSSKRPTLSYMITFSSSFKRNGFSYKEYLSLTPYHLISKEL